MRTTQTKDSVVNKQWTLPPSGTKWRDPFNQRRLDRVVMDRFLVSDLLKLWLCDDAMMLFHCSLVVSL